MQNAALARASQFAAEYRVNPTPHNAYKLRLARWLGRNTEGARLMQRMVVKPQICLAFDHPDKNLPREVWDVLNDWSCTRPTKPTN